ncbi:hypothetical protein [Verminephrobacter aporrectodeae]|uniref:hypothetical protein n=1 Tax=Verminephrobacter aporrectodeae TaxID=1110389 RepID=UPI002237C09C|nr:hypothetical protein [Verminephrobacter aporrectodeae]
MLIKMRYSLLFFAVCSQAYALDHASHPVQQASGSRQIKCPSRDFSEFIKVFSESKEVQIKFTKYPLKEQWLDLTAMPEPKPVMQKSRRNQIDFPVIPDEVERKQRDLILRIDEIKSNRAKLTLTKDDTDHLVNYFFSLNSCWNLVRIEDWSL